MKSGDRVPWLNAEQAAVYLGFVKADGAPNMNAFYIWKCRSSVRANRIGGRLRFRQVDLDRCVEPEPVLEAPRPRLVGGRL